MLVNKFRIKLISLLITAVVLASCQTAQDNLVSGASSASTFEQAADTPTDQLDAVRLANQGAMGASEDLVATIQQQGPTKWILGQFEAPSSVFTQGRGSLMDTSVSYGDNGCLIETDWNAQITCNWESSGGGPVQRDFVLHALNNPDQLRQRVALALSQILVVGNVGRTYGTRAYQQLLGDHAFDNYREILHQVTISPVMGMWLNLVDSEANSPNENYARELMELFTIGKCNLNPDGSLTDGKCIAPYDNVTVTENAAALTGWTYPVGGARTPMWCYSNYCADGRNPIYMTGQMLPVATRHDVKSHQLLSGVVVPANSTPEQALNLVLDSVMNHPNVGPFIARSLIQFMVTSNPSFGYVQRVATAFNTGIFQGIGAGIKGDMKATIAAILLDDEARNATTAATTSYGRLRENPLAAVAALRALGATPQGNQPGLLSNLTMTWPSLYMSSTIFNFFPPVFPVPGALELNGPEFMVQTVESDYARTNFMNWLVMMPHDEMSFNWAAFESDAETNPSGLIDRLDTILTGGHLPASAKTLILSGMTQWTAADQANAYYWQYYNTGSNWRRERVKLAAFLILSSPSFQIQR